MSYYNTIQTYIICCVAHFKRQAKEQKNKNKKEKQIYVAFS